MSNQPTTATTTPSAHARELKERLDELSGYMNQGVLRDEVVSIVDELRALSNYLIGLEMKVPSRRNK